MNLTAYSKNRLMASLAQWSVPQDFAEPMYNYLVHGYEPGSFFKGWYANDATAIIHSHIGNTVESLKDLTKWMINCMPDPAWGSYAAVDDWIKMKVKDRRFVLEHYDLVYTEAEEIVCALKNVPVVEPGFYS